MVSVRSMGQGGGAEIQIWSAQADSLRQVFSHYPDSFTDVNTWEAACGQAKVDLVFNGDRLQAHTCFDGKAQPVKSYRFDGTQFIQLQ